jgi:hypothetical protein
MFSNRKGEETTWNAQNVPMDFDLCSTLEESPVGRKVISQYFPGVWDIFKMNDICSSYLLRKDKEKIKPAEGNVRDCLDKIADVFAILQETTYPLYLLKMNLNKVALDSDGPLAANLRKTLNWLNSKIYELENIQLDKETLKACADAAREASAEIPEQLEGGGNSLSFAERRLIIDIAELYQHIHGEWPLRKTELPGSTGPLDEIMSILGDFLGCGSLAKLIRDFDLDLKRSIEKEQAVKVTRGKTTGSQNLITT